MAAVQQHQQQHHQHHQYPQHYHHRQPLTVVPRTPSIDALPLYTRRDPDASSIHSSAPSYVSEAPSYTSSSPARPTARRSTTTPTRRGLPPTVYAPGFRRAHSSSTSSAGGTNIADYNIREWSPVNNGPQAKHYRNVANRRATMACIEEEVRLSALARNMALAPVGSTLEVLAPLSNMSSSESATTSTGTTSTTVDSDSSSSTSSTPEPAALPHSPLEDPDLVGHAAAKAARERRLYMQRCGEDREAFKQEGKSWDFMLSQMSDWQEREKSWEKFRAEMVGGRGVLGRRIR